MLHLYSSSQIPATLRILTILVVLVLVNTQNVFNYEISGRVIDMIASFTAQIESVVLQSTLEIELIKGVVNNSNSNHISDNMVSILEVYPNMVNLYICFETGLFYQHVDQSYQLKNLTLSNVCKTPRYLNRRLLQTPNWSGPFVTTSYDISYPVLNYEKPLYKNINGSNVYIGMIASDILYSSLSIFLSETYNNSDKNVFIVDCLTGYIMGSSISVQTSYNNVNILTLKSSINLSLCILFIIVTIFIIKIIVSRKSCLLVKAKIS